MPDGSGLRIAVEGCCHGELDNIYATVRQLEAQGQPKLDLLLICGDFQAMRNVDDLECMACPPKYRHMQSFHKYYSGQAQAPVLTIFIGGNHEASNYLWELYYGGWVAPNIYYLGHAGVVHFGGLRIGGLSGIFMQHNWSRPHVGGPPYQGSAMKSAYHVRELEVFRLMKLQGAMDIFLSHDWPARIAFDGNKQRLLQRKSFLRTEVEDGRLGSPPARALMGALRPRYWFSAHMHTKFAALVPHADGDATRFLALDKCLPGRHFLQVLDIEPSTPGPKQLAYDAQWLAILRETHDLLRPGSFTRLPASWTGQASPQPPPEEEHLELVSSQLQQHGAAVPANFARTARTHDGSQPNAGRMPTEVPWNPQTEALLQLIGRGYNLDGRRGAAAWAGPQAPAAPAAPNAEEIDLDAGADDVASNPEEIDLDAELAEDDPDLTGAGAAEDPDEIELE